MANIIKITDEIDNDSSVIAASANAVKTVYDTYTSATNNELAIRHEGITSNGIGNKTNYCLITPNALSIANNMNLDSTGKTSNLNDVVAIGYSALKNSLNTSSKRCSDNIAIGAETMSQGSSVGPHNIAIGLWALRELEGTKTQDANNGGFDADRNIAIGSLAFTHLTQGRCNVGLGRDVGQTITTGNYNTCVGYAAMSGSAPIGIDGKIALQNQVTGTYNTIIGSNSGNNINGDSSFNLIVGGYAGRHIKNTEYITVIGCKAAETIDYYKSKNNKKLIYLDNTIVTYNQIGKNLTINYTNNDAASTGYLRLIFKTGDISIDVNDDQQTLEYTLNSTGNPVIQSIDDYDGASGEVALIFIESSEELGDTTTISTIIGGRAAQYSKDVQNSTIVGTCTLDGNLNDYSKTSTAKYSEVIGALSARNGTLTSSFVGGYRSCGGGHSNIITVSDSICVGSRTAYNSTKVNRSVIIGKDAGQSANTFETSVIIGWTAHTGSGNTTRSTIIGANSGPKTTGGTSSSDVFIGASAGKGIGTGNSENCTAIGTGALSGFDSFNSDTTKLSNSIAIGAWSKVTGSNQCQLGTTGVTTYTYGSVQDRSDARDKTDIRDTILGLDFINALRPVDFKWDYRDDYIEIEADETDITKINYIKHEKDGSKKRTRYHHGLIAQEVKKVMDKFNIDFGGYQDHKINGGDDVLTIGYSELISPIIKAIQELTAKNNYLKAKIESIEQKLKD